MTTICQCGKEIKGNYKVCFDCNKKSKLTSTQPRAEGNTDKVQPSAPLGVLSTEERILRGQCLNIVANANPSATFDRLIDTAEQLYNKIKQRGYL